MKTVENVENELQREVMVEWCSLLSGYSTTYFERKNDDELLEEYISLMATAAKKVIAADEK